MSSSSIELRRCSKYIAEASDELDFADWAAERDTLPLVLAPEGFEERSLGVLRGLAKAGVHSSAVVLGRYDRFQELNKTHRKEFEELAEAVAPGAWRPA